MTYEFLSLSRVQNDPYPYQRENHGKPWTPQMHQELCRLWCTTDTCFEEITVLMGRSHDSVTAKLRSLGYLTYDQAQGGYHCKNRSNGKQTTEPTDNQENNMTLNIETKTFINGVDASQLTDAQIFDRIARIELEIDKLGNIRAKSTKLQHAMDMLRKDVDDLVAFVDAR